MDRHGTARHSVLVEHRPDLGWVDFGERDSVGDGHLKVSATRTRAGGTYTPSLSPFDGDCRRLLVETDAETFQLVDDDFEIVEGFQDVEHDKDEVACPGDGDDLSTSTFTIFGSLDDTSSSARSVEVYVCSVPGRSRTCILAPLWVRVPGTVVRVVNSYEATSEWVPLPHQLDPTGAETLADVNLDMSVDLPCCLQPNTRWAREDNVRPRGIRQSLRLLHLYVQHRNPTLDLLRHFLRAD